MKHIIVPITLAAAAAWILAIPAAGRAQEYGLRSRLIRLVKFRSLSSAVRDFRNSSGSFIWAGSETTWDEEHRCCLPELCSSARRSADRCPVICGIS